VGLPSDIADELGISIHLDAHTLNRTGANPEVLIKEAIRIMERQARAHEPFEFAAVFLDADVLEADANRKQRALKSAREASLHLIVQHPDHEGLLLRHLPGCDQRRPGQGQSLNSLAKEWPGYQKPMSRRELGRKLGVEDIKRACGVERELAQFLRRLGLPV
jgi:hypothetical protein